MKYGDYNMMGIWVLVASFSVIFLSLELVQLFGILPVSFAPYLRAVVFALAVLLYVLSLLISKKAKILETKNRRTAFGVSACLLCIAIVFSSIYNVYLIIVLHSPFSLSTKVLKTPIFYIIYSVLGFIAAIYFCTVSFSELSSESVHRKRPLFALFPALWFCFGLIIKFSESIASVGSIESSIEVLAIVFSMLFIFVLAKKHSFNDDENNKVLLYGCLALVFSFASSVRYFIKIILFSEGTLLMASQSAVMFFMAIYIIFYFLTICEYSSAAGEEYE